MKLKASKSIIALALAALATAPASAGELFQPLHREGVDMIMAVKSGMIDYLNYIYMTPGFYTLKYADNYQPDKTKPDRPATIHGGMTYHDGIIYTCEYNDEFRLQEQAPYWRKYNAETLELIDEHQLPANFEATTKALTYDVTQDLIYGIIETYTENFLVKVDPETGQMTRISALDRNFLFLGICCDRDGNLYTIYYPRYGEDQSNHYLARLQKSTGKLANIGPLSCGGFLDGDPFVNNGQAQCMFYNSYDDRMFWIHHSASNYINPAYNYSPIMEIDRENATATMVAYMEQEYYTTGIIFREPNAKLPEVVSDIAYVPSSADRLTGKIQMQIPARDFGGSPLPEGLELQVMDGNSIIIEQAVTPGELFQSDEMTLSPGYHNLSAIVTNDNGKSPLAEDRIYVGYDSPAKCLNITLTGDDLTTTLTWDTPDSGVNGLDINPDTFTYNVVRYPGEITVAQGVTERSFTESHPGTLTRYVYMVYAVDQYGRNGVTAYSNNLIVGNPLDPPYGKEFEDAADMYNYYSIYDANNDGYTWAFDTNTNSAVYIYSIKNQADDWMVAPPINYQAGQEYEITFSALSSLASYPEALEVRFGNDRRPEAQTQLLLEIPEVPAADLPVQFSTKFTPETDGVHYFSFHAVSPAYSEYLYVSGIHVEGAESSVEKLNADDSRVLISVENGNLIIRNPDCIHISVFDSAGRRVATANGANSVLPLSSGIYVVATPAKATKVII